MIYFLRSPSARAVKIGRSSNVYKRALKIQTSSPTPLKLVAVFEGDAAEEKRLHRLFREHHIRGEWYRWCAPIRKMAKATLYFKGIESSGRGGRPRVGATPVNIRLPPDMLALLDGYRGGMTRAEAIRKITRENI